MDCGSIGWGFDSLFLPLYFFKYSIWFNFLLFQKLNHNVSILCRVTLTNFLNYLLFLSKAARINDLFWQEGFLIDFLQKKIVDNWVKKFLILSSYLFNERFLFEKLTRFFLDFFIWPFTQYFFFDFNNVTNLFFFTIFFFIFAFASFSLYFFLMFI